MRPRPLVDLLESVKGQTLYPDQILIIDGSRNDETQFALQSSSYANLQYFKVEERDRGLTKQRNFGITKVEKDIDIVCFLDDDTILDPSYFEEILKTYDLFPAALGVGGYISNEDEWNFVGPDYIAPVKEYFYDGWRKNDGSRFVLRKRLGLDSDTKPGFLPEFSHGRSIGFLPPSDKIYEVEQLMGGVSSFRKSVFESFQFSTYFEGYGLYEDADFTLRLSKAGKLYVNTAAKLGHFHDSSGRPSQYRYGKMVVRNGWYVWRIKHRHPSLKSQVKWHTVTLLLAFVRLINTFTTTKKEDSFFEFLGRMVGWFSLLLNKPQLPQNDNI